MTIDLAIVVPARNAASTLPRCLSALRRAVSPGTPIIVVDDGSTDATATVAREAGALVRRFDRAGGPARARNAGAAMATAPIVLFVDADVVVAPDAAARVRAAFAADPGLAAVFGSYDATPAAGTLVSDYRNLLHHFVHQQARADSRSFWAGLGAVRRQVLQRCGGFDERFDRPAIEDIELGARIAAAGHRIRLDHHLRGTHLKRWTLGDVVRTDVLARARPWSLLLLRDRTLPRDLNLQPRHRASGLLVWVAPLLAAAAVAAPRWRGPLMLGAAGAAVGLALLNLDFYRFLARQRGIVFAAASYPLHALYYACASATFAWCCIEHLAGRLPWRRSSVSVR